MATPQSVITDCYTLIDCHYRDPRKFQQLQTVLFGAVCYYKKEIIHEIWKTHFEEFKEFFGKRSWITHTINYKQTANLKRKEAQTNLVLTLRKLQEMQKIEELESGFIPSMRSLLGMRSGLPRLLEPEIALGIIEDAKTLIHMTEVKWPNIISTAAREILDDDDMGQIPMLSDCCEDHDLMEAANHFRDPRIIHTWTCPYLHSMKIWSIK